MQNNLLSVAAQVTSCICAWLPVNFVTNLKLPGSEIKIYIDPVLGLITSQLQLTDCDS